MMARGYASILGLILLLSSRGCFASNGSSAAEYIDPNNLSVQVGALVAFVLILTAIFFIGWQEKKKTGHWPRKHILPSIIISWFVLNALDKCGFPASCMSCALIVLGLIFTTILFFGWHERRKLGHWPREYIVTLALADWLIFNIWDKYADRYPSIRPSYDLIACPLAAGFLLVSFVDGLKGLRKGRLKVWYYILLLILLSACLFVIFREEWKTALTYTHAFRYAMAAVAAISAWLSYKLFFSKPATDDGDGDRSVSMDGGCA
jgi:hypothetical protein